MQYKTLGNSDLKVSQISFGCMSLGTDHDANQNILHHAHDLGVNFFDTADLYQNGFNEETVGKALKDRRDKVFIATKVGNQIRKDGTGWDWNPSKKYIKTAIHNSLRRLQTDYIDLYQLHGGTIEDPVEETIEAFEELKQEGYIRWYGISSIRPNVIRKWAEISNISSVMMQYSMLDRRPEENCLDLLKEKNIGVTVRGALAKGLLAGKEAKSYLNRSQEVVQMLQNKLEKFTLMERSPSQTALQFILANPAVSTIAAGIRTLEQLKENVATLSAPSLNFTQIKALQNLVPPNFYEKHLY